MGGVDGGFGGGGGSGGTTGTGNMTVRRAPGTANAATPSLSSLTSLKSTAPPSSNPFPTVTYRHLLSAGSLTPANPLRVIAHCDVDAAYAQFEAQRLGIDSFAVPLAVQQWQGLIAIGYKAREFGINRHCDVTKAKQLCPDIHCVHVQTIAPGDLEPAYHDDPRPETHKVSLDPYRRESRKILASFKATCPLGQVEKASIDESYFDLTVEVRKLILTRYPHLKQCPKTAKGMDEPLPAPPLIEWDGCGELMPVKRLDDDGNVIEQDSQEGFVPSQEHQLLEPTWTDVALAHGAMLMTRVRKDVLLNVGYTTSAGIASNKTLAKLCSGFRKPNNQTTLLPRAVPAFLRDLPVSKIRFLGGKLGREMGDMWDAQTVGDLWSVPLEQMQTHFGPEAAWVHAVLRGIDHAPVSARIANKTMLASKNLRPFIRKRSEALGWLETLSTELVTRLREVWEDERHGEPLSIDDNDLTQGGVTSNGKAKNVIPTLWPKFLVLRFIRTRGQGARSRQAAFPYVSNLKANDVYKVAVRLWNEACDEMRLGVGLPSNGNSSNSSSGAAVQDMMPVEVVTIALGFSGLERAEMGQKTIEGFFGGKATANGASNLAQPEAKKRKASEKTDDIDEEKEDGNALRWTCDECKEIISVKVAQKNAQKCTKRIERKETDDDVFDNDNPFGFATAPSSSLDVRLPDHDNIDGPLIEMQDAQSRLDVQVQDHKDWHFAVRLSMQQDETDDNNSSSGHDVRQNMNSEGVSSSSISGLKRKPEEKKINKKPKKGSLQSFFAQQNK